MIGVIADVRLQDDLFLFSGQSATIDEIGMQSPSGNTNRGNRLEFASSATCNSWNVMLIYIPV